MGRPSILTRKLFEHADAKASELAMAFPGLGRETRTVSWIELRDHVLRLARHLQDAGCQPGDPVLVLTSSPWEQILGFLSAQVCAAVPSVLSHPSVKQSDEMFRRMLRPIVTQSGAGYLLHAEAYTSLVATESEATTCVAMAAEQDLPSPTTRIDKVARDELFRQFSSGTTGARKSVLITSRMFESHAESYGRSVGLHDDDRVISWLPLYHDMGLLCSFLIPFYHGVFSLHLSPFEWLQNPASLFTGISRYGGTLAWMPNFAFSYCAQRVADEDLEEPLDLSRFRAFVSGGEPVTAKAQDEFIERFRRHGLAAHQVQVIYGMAENTVAITQSELGTTPRRDRVARDPFLESHDCTAAPGDAPETQVLTFVSCGRTIDDTELRIDDGAPERRVGEIQVRGASLFGGYSFAEAGEAGTEGVFTDDGWFRTGDLGYLAGGELFVTGRAKDVIVHRGSNVYPADVEDVIGRMEGCKPGRIVVFGVRDEEHGTEEVIAMLEPAAALSAIEPRELVARVREEVLSRFNVALADVVVVEQASLQKSTSGKISRTKNRAHYLEQQRERSAPAPEGGVAARDLQERQIARIWQEVLKTDGLGVQSDFFADLGGDSVRAARTVELINARFDTDFGPELIIQARTIEQQAALVRDRDGDHRILVAFRRDGSKCPLFLAHPAGGSVFGYDGIARALPDRPVYGLQDPHIFSTQGLFESIEEMAEAYLPHLRRAQPEGPYMLGGWSLGGILAFEMANRLVAEGEQVANLILFDAASPPSAAERRRLFWRFVPARTLLLLMAGLPPLRWLLAPLTIHRRLAGLDNITRAREMARFDIDESPGSIRLFFPDAPPELRAGGLDRILEDAVKLSETRDNIVPGISPRNHIQRRRIHQRNLTQLFRKYQPTWRYPGRTTLFRQAEEAVAPWRQRGSTLHYDWQRYCVGPLDVHEVELLATEAQPDPHDNTLLPLNTDRYMPRVREALDRSEP